VIGQDDPLLVESTNHSVDDDDEAPIYSGRSSPDRTSRRAGAKPMTSEGGSSKNYRNLVYENQVQSVVLEVSTFALHVFM
jgi:hypothetical protein